MTLQAFFTRLARSMEKLCMEKLCLTFLGMGHDCNISNQRPEKWSEGPLEKAEKNTQMKVEVPRGHHPKAWINAVTYPYLYKYGGT